jgi:hypothetical protein
MSGPNIKWPTASQYGPQRSMSSRLICTWSRVAESGRNLNQHANRNLKLETRNSEPGTWNQWWSKGFERLVGKTGEILILTKPTSPTQLAQPL